MGRHVREPGSTSGHNLRCLQRIKYSFPLLSSWLQVITLLLSLHGFIIPVISNCYFDDTDFLQQTKQH